MFKPGIILTVSAWLLALPASGGNWPEFRGPGREGHATAKNLPTEWNTTSNVAWKQAVPGKGWSSPVIQDGRIYLTAAVPEEGGSNLALSVFCLNEKDGGIVWKSDVFTEDTAASAKIHAKNTHASPTPVIEGKRIYVHFGHQGTACLDLDGKVVWRNSSLGYTPVHGNGGSPIIVDNKLIFSGDAAKDPFIVALDKETGSVIWNLKRETEAKRKFTFSTPLLITVNGQRQLISQASGAVIAYDPQDGREIWRVRYGEGYSVVPRPVFGHGLLFIATGFDKPTVMAIRPDGKGDVTDTHVAWTLTKGAPLTPSPLLVGEELYLVADVGVASCLDAKTGTVHWSERVGGNYSASPLYADGKIYLQSEQGNGVVLKPGKTFQTVSTNVLGERTLASYAVDDNALFIRTESSLYRIGKAK
jgi:outer membrane protein assembly factor BamB